MAVAAVVGAVHVFERLVLARLGAGAEPPSNGGEPPTVAARSVPTPDGGQLYVEERGSGPPIVLLHGHGAALGTFSVLAPRLADHGHHVVAVDLRGFGRSSTIPDGFAFDGLVDDLVTVLEALDARDAIVAGHSMGGTIALGLAIHHPDAVADRVRGLVLLNSIARGPANDRLHRAMVAAMDWPALERLSRHPRHGVFLARTNFGADARRSDVEAARLVGLQSPVSARQGFARRLLGTDLSADLSKVHLPVLAIAGSADRVVPARESTRLAELLPNATVEVVAGAGHMLPMSVPMRSPS